MKWILESFFFFFFLHRKRRITLVWQRDQSLSSRSHVGFESQPCCRVCSLNITGALAVELKHAHFFRISLFGGIKMKYIYAWNSVCMWNISRLEGLKHEGLCTSLKCWTKISQSLCKRVQSTVWIGHIKKPQHLLKNLLCDLFKTSNWTHVGTLCSCSLIGSLETQRSKSLQARQDSEAARRRGGEPRTSALSRQTGRGSGVLPHRWVQSTPGGCRRPFLTCSFQAVCAAEANLCQMMPKEVCCLDLNPRS